MFTDRKASFKAPPAAVRQTSTSQAARRDRALEEQKRRRAERFDSTRSLDILADLSLGHSDDDTEEDGNRNGSPEVVREGIGLFASMLPPLTSLPGPSLERPAAPASSSESMHPTANTPSTTLGESPRSPEKARAKGSKRKGKGRSEHATRGGNNPRSGGKGTAKPSKWADKCMYAELLEMNEGLGALADGIPDDIESAFVAVTPVPVGKRCLAVTHQTSGIAGVVPNTTLRSRVLGKALMKPFPSTLPPQTVLDCILDDNWRDNGVLHVLDVISWKGQDVADCETPFRFWWRDTRLSELATFPPPPNSADFNVTATRGQHPRYQFSYPTTFAPIPYHTDTTLAHLLSVLIPLTHTARTIPVSVPATAPIDDAGAGAMELDRPVVQLRVVQAEVRSDGLLLYVSQASYEPGTSPLSTWVPLRAYQTREEQERGISAPESPLNVFERLVRRRIASKDGLGTPEVEMDS